MSKQIVIGISDQSISKSPDTLVTYALGSCIGISLFDESTGIGGLSHIMLPYSSLIQNGNIDRNKFADTAIEDMVDAMVLMGANRTLIKAKIAGGANMFKIADDSVIGSIGDRNIESVRNELMRLGIPLVAEDIGADYGRTVFFELETGKVRVQSLGKLINEM
jgi:chemotaxis protein CheD